MSDMDEYLLFCVGPERIKFVKFTDRYFLQRCSWAKRKNNIKVQGILDAWWKKRWTEREEKSN